MRYYREIILLEAIIFILLWITNEYLASLLTFIAVPVFLAILIISLLAEAIDRSKVGRSYFWLMLGLGLVPAIIFLVMFIANGGTSFDWARQ